MEESLALKVIGYMRSPFMYKNGTPRQSGICQQVTGEITIEKKIFNNPEHSLEGLEKFSHLWIFFIFHKNNNVHSKAKVKPPRLNGARTGVFSTRSPYRPNNIGLTLGKIEHVKGATVTVSGIDILDGTPIIDLKPYISQYDNPAMCSQNQSVNDVETEDQSTFVGKSMDRSNLNDYEEIEVMNAGNIEGLCTNEKSDEREICDHQNKEEYAGCEPFNAENSVCSDEMHKLETHTNDRSVLAYCPGDKEHDIADTLKFSHHGDKGVTGRSGVQSNVNKCISSMKQTDCANTSEPITEDISNDSKSSTADWISNSPVCRLIVRFTPSAEDQLILFSAGSTDIDFRLKFLKSYQKAKEAIVNILHEDPRSTYRRNHCPDALYYFTLDVMHITCWFDEELVEILRVKPIRKVEKLYDKK